MIKAAALLTLAAIGLAPIAHADTDAEFLQAVAAKGIQGPPDQLIAAGHAACDNWGHVWALYGVRLNIQQQLGISDTQAAAVMWAGIHAYCPQNSP